LNSPSNESAERVLLGAALLDPVYLDQIQEKLRADDLFLAAHQRILLRMYELQRSGSAIDIITLSALLTARNELQSVNGVAYLASLTEDLPRRPVIDDYIAIVKDCAIRRRVMQACGVAVAQAEAGEQAGGDVIGKLQYELDSIVNSQADSSDMESVGQWLAANDVFAKREPGIMTGIDGYDELTYGLHKGELTVIAGRTSMGKSSMAGTISWQVALRGKFVSLFANEQQKGSIMGRMLCAKAGVFFESYRHGRLDWVEKQYIGEAIEEFKKLPLYWDQRPSMSVSSIRAKSRKMKRSGELDLVIVDQLSRVNGEGIERKGMSRDELVGEKVSALKAVAMELDVPLILFHQLTRDTLKNDDKRPDLTNLKYSDAIADHADNVAFLHRPGYYDRSNHEIRTEAEILLRKCRDGPTGDVKCEFVPELCRWQNKEKKR
jgi:replicative DNA helicase